MGVRLRLALEAARPRGPDQAHTAGDSKSAQSRPVHRRAGEPAVIISRPQADPAFMPLAVDEGLAGFALRLQRIELLFEPFLGRLAGVDRTAHGSVPPRCGSGFFHWPASATRMHAPVW